MGRYKERQELKGRRGPGRKAKKQSEPGLPVSLLGDTNGDPALGVKQGKIGGRIKQRARKRELLLAAAKAAKEELKIRKQEKRRRSVVTTGNSFPKESGTGGAVDGNAAPSVEFIDSNKSWLKPVKSILKSPGQPSPAKKVRVCLGKLDVLDGASDGHSSEEGCKCK